MRGAAVPATRVLVLDPAHAQPGGVHARARQPVVEEDLAAPALRHYRHVDLLQRVAVETIETLGVFTPAAGPAVRLFVKIFLSLVIYERFITHLSVKVLSWSGQTHGPNVLLVDEVVLGDEDGEVVPDPLGVVVRVELDAGDGGLLDGEGGVVLLHVVLPAPHVDLVQPVPDVEPSAVAEK